MDSILDKVKLPAGYPLSWARLVSDLLSPPVMWAALAVPIALRDAITVADGWLWALNYIVLVCFMPVGYIFWLVKNGRVTDIHLKLRRQRVRPFVASIAGALLATGVLVALNASDVMLLFVVFTVIQLSLMAAITMLWQISIHAMSISGAAIAVAALFSPLWLLLLLPMIMLVGVARLKLKRHTPAQVVMGTLVGVIVPLFLFLTVSP